ncbi:PREDICTED: leucine-rich repeat-containing protein 46 isoform X1 [Bison bison bison]|uniref:Leucine-rich repeat-containing protein 46 n=1 Tax=Bison bison bison TaxID=43346 RepID=A0A6P3HDA8_BISBB|nr:PREDICTED: leucine-rich repeat-containing protein 46 isoform X1 [Bison bison bison]XP_010841007.1 PREDICTED: leucine-rich repeat-containing protein 46 isoform X1 [Bison bison bison]XP_010841008.1 PREDICTED: leucine-rich repeat-containing protein 46 isoform X1 [Bison bison bison]
MPGAKLAQSPEEISGVCITEALITRRNLAFPEDEDLSEKITHLPRFHTLAELQTVRLDREGITTIRNLEGLQNLHSLYLQGNKIQRIENLACVPSLRFLSLAGNQIRQVENLRDLPHLQFLDLSENLIETLKLDEFPESLLILNLTGNSCTNQDGYRKLLTEALPLLLELDGQPVAERWTSDEEDTALSDEDEEFPELRGPFCSERGFLKELEQGMSRHRELRQQTALLEHQLRVETQPTLTDLPPLPGAPMAGDSSPSVTPTQEKETTPEPASLPEASSTTKRLCPLAPRGQQSTMQARKGARAATAPKASLAGAPSTTKTVTKKIKK